MFVLNVKIHEKVGILMLHTLHEAFYKALIVEEEMMSEG
jgi:hypothetical protein